ncbi:porin [Microvirga roseola]|uniref:porin n=1 Tax=Microvirga roseola TaxID=2883126 RepID=UPI001E44C9AF|nr:porin [Microvirga roseola]
MKRLALVLLGLVLAGAAYGAPRGEAQCQPGFALLEDGATCVRISGRVRADSIVGEDHGLSRNSVELETSGRIQLDVRRRTEYGPLRAVIRVEGQKPR